MSKQILQWFYVVNALLVSTEAFPGKRRVAAVLQLGNVYEPRAMEEAFIKAACNGSLSRIKKLIALNPSIINVRHESGTTALACAAAQGHKGLVHYLLEHGADPALPDLLGRTPLIHAAREGHDKIVSCLMRADKAGIDWCDQAGVSALITAVTLDRAAVVQTLLRGEASLRPLSAYQLPILSFAISNSSSSVVPILLQAGSSCNESMEFGFTPLMLAAEKNESAIAQQLLQHKADVEAKEINGHTALMVAAINDAQATGKALLDAGALVEAKDLQGNTALHWAAFHGQAAMVNLLLNAGAQVEAKNCKGCTPLVAAIHNGCITTVRYLLKAKANVHVQGAENDTMLMVALGAKNRALFSDLFYTYSFDLEQKDCRGNTILLHAVKQGEHDICISLIKQGACINAKNDAKETALLLAVRGKHRHIGNYLLGCKGIEVNHADVLGHTSLMLASQKKDADLCVRLLALGADEYAYDSKGKDAVAYTRIGGSSEVMDQFLLRAPYLFLQKNLQSLGVTAEQVQASIDQRYQSLHEALSAVMFDDERDINAGVKLIAEMEVPKAFNGQGVPV